ncbi:hypothetical protein J4430_01450 [Candidatus Woesearchaeota archaeon]|nr:hypothetical protein [Candidatus Woesearchaeota archaeon]
MFVDFVLFDNPPNPFGFSKVYPVKQINFQNVSDVRRVSSSQSFVVAEGGKFNREILEQPNVSILLCPEKSSQGDFLHHRNSGLNQVLCKLAVKNHIAIGFSFSSLLLADSSSRFVFMGRMHQNILLCRKYKVPMIFASFARTHYEMRPAHDLLNFAQVLGMTPLEARSSLQYGSKLLEERSFSKGVRRIG